MLFHPTWPNLPQSIGSTAWRCVSRWPIDQMLTLCIQRSQSGEFNRGYLRMIAWGIGQTCVCSFGLLVRIDKPIDFVLYLFLMGVSKVTEPSDTSTSIGQTSVCSFGILARCSGVNKQIDLGLCLLTSRWTSFSTCFLRGPWGDRVWPMVVLVWSGSCMVCARSGVPKQLGPCTVRARPTPREGVRVLT